jgi:predicted ATP-grasp superfamily ATP-dependent carboligase
LPKVDFFATISVVMPISLKSPVVYVCRDIERALGIFLHTPNYFIISNLNDFAKRISNGAKNILLIKSDKILDTRDLLVHQESSDFLKKIASPKILVFKNTPQIEKICAEMKFELLNPSSELSNTVEEKLSQVNWLAELAGFLPEHKIQKTKDVEWNGEKFILQFNRAHTGSGTELIENTHQLDELKKIFPDREARVTRYVVGPAFTNNNIVWGEKILYGNINYQITGLPPFTNRKFATVGNDWRVPNEILSQAQKQEFFEIARKVGEKLVASGWRGLFGIDVVLEKQTGKIYLIEINARQPASASFESELQRKIIEGQKLSDKFITTFDAHLLSLCGEKYSGESIVEIKDGAQVVQRILDKDSIKKDMSEIITEIKSSGFNVVEYDNTEVGADKIRIQSERGIIKNDGDLNEIGERIIKILEK